MTILELYSASKDISPKSMCVVRCKYDNYQVKSVDDVMDGCIIYKNDFYTMPKVIRDLNVMSFKCIKPAGALDEPGKWEIWVV